MRAARVGVSVDEMVRPFGMRETGVTFVDDDGNSTRLSYDELANRAASVAAQLAGLGVAPGDSVGIGLENTPAAVVAQMGIWMAGARLLSLPPPPRREAATYEQGFRPVLRSADCRLLIGTERILGALGDVAPALSYDQLDLDGSHEPPDPTPGAASLVQFSSGSTGTPKGILLAGDVVAGHVGVITATFDVERARDRTVSWLPLYHDMGFVGLWLCSLATRMDITLMTPRYFVRHPWEWIGACARERATVTAAPDFAYRLAARTLAARELAGDLGDMRVCLCGAEPIAWSTLEAFLAATEPYGFRRESLMPVYGLAEATLAVTAPPVGRGPTRDASGAVALGRPLEGFELRLREREGGTSTLDIRGPWLLDGYLTAGGFVHPLDEDGWLQTNDVAHIEDGELFVRGRADEAIVVRGRNVFAEDVESIAMSVADHEPIAVAAFRPPDADDRFALAIELIGDTDPSAVIAKVQAAVKTSLETKVAPIVALAPRGIPRTTSGKVRRSACRRILAEDGWSAEETLAWLR